MMEIVVLTLLLASGAESGEWFRGGTVVNASLHDWSKTNTKNQLASAAELLAVAKAVPSMAELEPRAKILAACVSEGVRFATLRTRVTHQANACMLRLGWIEQSVKPLFDQRYPPPSPSVEEYWIGNTGGPPGSEAPSPKPKTYNIPDYVGRWKSEGPHYGKFWVLDIRLDGTMVIEIGLERLERQWHRLGRHCIVSAEAPKADEFYVLQANRLLAVDNTFSELDSYLAYARASNAPTGTTTTLPPHSPADVPSICGR